MGGCCKGAPRRDREEDEELTISEAEEEEEEEEDIWGVDKDELMGNG